MISDFALPPLSSASRWRTSLCRNRSSSCSCQSVCSIALRPDPTELKARPGASVPSSWVFGSACSKTSRALRWRNFSSPTFSSTSAFFPSQTTTQSPWRTLSLDMRHLQRERISNSEWRIGSRHAALATCYLLLATRYSLLATRYSLFATRYSPFAQSVAAVQQPPGNHLRLNLRCALED